MPDQGKGKITVSEAGRRGGEKTAKTHSHEFYESIGKRGGRKGGETTARRHGHKFYEEIGHKGGQKVKKLIEKGKKAIGAAG